MFMLMPSGQALPDQQGKLQQEIFLETTCFGSSSFSFSDLCLPFSLSLSLLHETVEKDELSANASHLKDRWAMTATTI